MKRFCVYWLPVIFLAAAIFIQSAFPSPEVMPSFPLSDKLLHGLAYGILAALCFRALRKSGPMTGQPLLSVALVAVLMATLYGASDEWHQSFVPARNADIFDLAADFVGSCVGAAAYAHLITRLKPLAKRHSLIDKIAHFL